MEIVVTVFDAMLKEGYGALNVRSNFPCYEMKINFTFGAQVSLIWSSQSQ
jgi:hypothetical protein